MGRVMLTMIEAFAELERDVIRERTIAGLEAARARGNVGGRPVVLSPVQIEAAKSTRTVGRSVVEIAGALGCSRATIYRALS